MQTAVARQVSFVAHDLKNPLTAIRIQAELALRQLNGSGGSNATRNLKGILRAVEWMNDLVGELLDAPVAPEDAAPLAPADFVLSAVDQLRLLAEARRVTFDISLAPDLPAVAAPRKHALPILLNVVANAIQHGPVGGAIHISAAAQGSHLVFCVRDEGAGIPRKFRGRVFQAGVRSANSRGHGLGLAIASSRVAELGGQIWVEPALPHGAMFHFSLPITSVDHRR